MLPYLISPVGIRIPSPERIEYEEWMIESLHTVRIRTAPEIFSGATKEGGGSEWIRLSIGHGILLKLPPSYHPLWVNKPV
jgi:hypothetical protein